MNRLEDLKEITDRNLGGLKADTRLLHQILNAKAPKASRIKWRPVLIASAAVVVLLCAGLIVLPRLLTYNGDMDVVTRSAGGDLASQTVQLTANVPPGSVNIGTAPGDVPGYRSLFAPGQGANFPLIKVGSATYRLLTEPAVLSADLAGEQLGAVTEYTSEPAVSSGGIVSNTVQSGEAVYAVRGMKGAAVAADVGGTLRAFQRVGYSGTAIVGGETLQDVLTGGAPAAAMQLTGVGSVTDASQAQALLNVLLSNARYEGAAESSRSNQSLLIMLGNGLTVQMNAGGGKLSACGTWSCPEFFTAFEDAVSD